jgi:hypothetical protein
MVGSRLRTSWFPMWAVRSSMRRTLNRFTSRQTAPACLGGVSTQGELRHADYTAKSARAPSRAIPSKINKFGANGLAAIVAVHHVGQPRGHRGRSCSERRPYCRPVERWRYGTRCWHVHHNSNRSDKRKHRTYQTTTRAVGTR